ncbi:MAG: hypothetical protein FWF57_06990 [Defluviitaleaceae bacterium]|nr:hypothetical protein [Defluviitaleaceae bacterium]
MIFLTRGGLVFITGFYFEIFQNFKIMYNAFDMALPSDMIVKLAEFEIEKIRN